MKAIIKEPGKKNKNHGDRKQPGCIAESSGRIYRNGYPCQRLLHHLQ